MDDAAKQAKAAIRQVETLEELKGVSDALSERWKALQNRQALRFAKGDEVVAETDGRYDGLRGRVLRVNKKSVSVEPADEDEAQAHGLRSGQYVRFGPSLLRHAG